MAATSLGKQHCHALRPFELWNQLGKRSGAIKFSCGFLSAKALFFCRKGEARVRVVWGEKSPGLSSESKSVGKSMGPSGSRRGGFVGIWSKTHCYRRVLLRNTCRTPPSSDASASAHCPTQDKSVYLCHLCPSSPRPRLASGIWSKPRPSDSVSVCGGHCNPLSCYSDGLQRYKQWGGS